MAVASLRHRDRPAGPSDGGRPLNLSSAAILAGIAVDAWLLAFIAIRGGRPWLQATYAACTLAYVALGAAFVGTNERVLAALRDDVALGIVLLAHALTAILVLSLIHGETLPRRRSVAFLLLDPVPLLAYLAPIEGWTTATAYEGNVLGGFLVLCLGVALAEALDGRGRGRVRRTLPGPPRVVEGADDRIRVSRDLPRRSRGRRGPGRPLGSLRVAAHHRGRGPSPACRPRYGINGGLLDLAAHRCGASSVAGLAAPLVVAPRSGAGNRGDPRPIVRQRGGASPRVLQPSPWSSPGGAHHRARARPRGLPHASARRTLRRRRGHRRSRSPHATRGGRERPAFV